MVLNKRRINLVKGSGFFFFQKPELSGSCSFLIIGRYAFLNIKFPFPGNNFADLILFQRKSRLLQSILCIAPLQLKLDLAAARLFFSDRSKISFWLIDLFPQRLDRKSVV